MATKYVFVTGGVVSSLGKGITAASIGALFEAHGLKVTLMKCDPYINVDPGTMSPFQHGEVYVTDDGAETDLERAEGLEQLRALAHGMALHVLPAPADSIAVDVPSDVPRAEAALAALLRVGVQP